MKSSTFLMALLAVLPLSLPGGEPPANSSKAVDETFDGSELGKAWHVNTGEWKISNGVLRAREIPADKHSAAARRAVVTQNAVYDFHSSFVFSVGRMWGS